MILVGCWTDDAAGAPLKALKETAEADAYATSLHEAAEIAVEAARRPSLELETPLQPVAANLSPCEGVGTAHTPPRLPPQRTLTCSGPCVHSYRRTRPEKKIPALVQLPSRRSSAMPDRKALRTDSDQRQDLLLQQRGR